MKKLLVGLASLSMVFSSVATVVACGTNKNLTEKEKGKFNYYEMDGYKFQSKEHAYEYFFNEGSTLIEENQYINKISFGGKNYETVLQVYNQIEIENKIEKIKTNVDPSQNVINGFNELDPNVAPNRGEVKKVYRDANGKALFNKSDELSEQAVKETYYDKVVRKYLLEDEAYNSADEIVSVYNERYANSGLLEKEACYVFDGICLSEGALKNTIKSTSKMNYIYNNQKIKAENIYDEGAFELSYEDKGKIKKLEQAPGLFYVSKREGISGVLSGDKIISYDGDLRALASNKNNWDKVNVTEFTGDDLLRHLDGLSYRAHIVKFYIFLKIFESGLDYLIEATKKIIDKCYGNWNGNIKVDTIIGCRTSDSNNNNLKELIDKYQINNNTELIARNLNLVNEIDPGVKELIFFYQLKELLINSNLSYKDSLVLNNFYKELLENLFKGVDGWSELLSLLSGTEYLDFFDVLVDSSDENLDRLSSLFENPDFRKYLTKVVNKVNWIVEWINNWLEIGKDYLDFAEWAMITILDLKYYASKSLIGAIPLWGDAFSALFSFLENINLTKTYTYKLNIPRSNSALYYEFTQFSFEPDKFDPGSVINILGMREPQADSVYRVNGKNFRTLEQAEKSLKENLFNSDQDIEKEYYSYLNPETTALTIEELVNKLSKDYLVNPKYVYFDHFGNYFSSHKEALDSMLKNLKDQNFQMEYWYYFSKNSDIEPFRNKDLNVLKKQIDATIKIEYKNIYWTDIYKTDNFDLLMDVTDDFYEIYSIEWMGVKKYFKDLQSIYNFVLYSQNFKNIFYYENVTKYLYKDMLFENIKEFYQYINENLVEKYTDNLEEIYQGGTNNA